MYRLINFRIGLIFQYKLEHTDGFQKMLLKFTRRLERNLFLCVCVILLLLS